MFRIKQEYEREELLNFVGSKQLVSGMIYGDKEKDCIILTSGGKHGEEAGYIDKKDYDGSWLYIGQGSKGDQNPYSNANSYLTKGEKTVLLFSTREPNSKEVKERKSRKKFYKFEGIFEVGSWNYYTPSEGKRAGNKLVQYHLIPVENIFSSEIDFSIVLSESSDLYKLRKKIKNQDLKPTKAIRTNIDVYRLRSIEVKEYALLRATGICEYCNKIAPFIDNEGIPFLEVHHIHKLADDGPDIPENVAAICPNCHKEAHYGINKEKIKLELIAIIKEKEKKLG